MSRENKLNLSSRETGYLNLWLFRYGKKACYQHRNVPELILSEYEKEISQKGAEFPPRYQIQRLNYIQNYIDFIINIEPRYKKLLKRFGMRGWEVGAMLGYKTPQTWHKSYKRYAYIRFFVKMIEKYEETRQITGK